MKLALYKGTRPGLAGVYNRGVRLIDRGPYSHVELVLSSGMSWSSSFEDKGVRWKWINYDPARWDFIPLPDHLERYAQAWFEAHEGAKYDVLGNVRFVLPFLPDGGARYFCSEAVAAALQIPDPWRYGPNGLASAVTLLNNPAPAGFFI